MRQFRGWMTLVTRFSMHGIWWNLSNHICRARSYGLGKVGNFEDLLTPMIGPNVYLIFYRVHIAQRKGVKLSFKKYTNFGTCVFRAKQPPLAAQCLVLNVVLWSQRIPGFIRPSPGRSLPTHPLGAEQRNTVDWATKVDTNPVANRILKRKCIFVTT